MREAKLPEQPTSEPARRALPTRAVIVAIYLVVFWWALPTLLWHSALALDKLLGWGWGHGPWIDAVRVGGAVLGLLSLVLLALSMIALWEKGRGLPVSALPPPKLARSGLYFLCRHPIYLAFDLALFFLGIALSPSLAFVVAPAFAIVWIAYASLEERGLRRRFGSAWDRYCREVGLLPRFSLYPLVWLAMRLQVIPNRVEGHEHIPASGPAILAVNHTCYLDPVYLGTVTARHLSVPGTAEAFRGGLMRWIMRHGPAIPVRRYRPDPVACREVLERLGAGRLVAMFVEGERSVLGDYAGCTEDLAKILRRIPVPVIPVGISGAYDSGPRWSGANRRRPITIRIGPPLVLGPEPKRQIDGAIRALLTGPDQPVHLDGLDRSRLERAVWRCPRCLDEAGWRPAELRCDSCGARWEGTPAGLLRDEQGREASFAATIRPAWEAPEQEPLTAAVDCWIERSMYGPILPLERVGEGELEVGPDGLRFGELAIPCAAVRSTTTERADTLQVATAAGMWQFRLERGSAFRLQRALDRWRERG